MKITKKELRRLIESVIEQEIMLERKKKKRKKKKTKSKKRGYLYPYGHGYHYDHDDISSDYGDFGFDAGGDGGGGE